MTYAKSTLNFPASIELTFDFTYEPGEAPTYDYPGSNPEVDITKVRLNGEEIPLKAITEEMYEQMIEQVIEEYG